MATMTGGLAGSRLERRLRAETQAEVHFDPLSRARYSTDASVYKILPLGVVIPRVEADIAAIAAIAAEEGVPVLARGGGTSTAGQTVSEGLIIDFSKHLRNLTFYDMRSMTCVVQPGMTLNAMNAELAKLGVWFPVDLWSGSQATIGGMCGNNAVGPRSRRYGAMRDNVTAIDAVLPDGTEYCFGEIRDNAMSVPAPRSGRDVAFDLLQLGERYEALIRKAAKAAPAHAGGYNLPALLPESGANNLAALLVGSEGTLALFRRIELKVQKLPRNWALGVCQFPSLRKALGAVADVASLAPSAIDLIEAGTLLMSGERHRKTVERYLRGGAAALLIVEFAEDNQVENVRRLKALGEVVSARGLGGRVIEAVGTDMQRAVWDARDAAHEAHLRGHASKALPFLEDCLVPFAEMNGFVDRIGELLTRAGVPHAWSGFALAEAFVLRPIYAVETNLSRQRLRALAEETSQHIRTLKGAMSAGQGSGLARSEFSEAVFGRSTISIFEEVKALFDPDMRFNPGKIVYAPRVDDPMLTRAAPRGRQPPPALDWPAGEAGPLAAADACTGVGVCRKLEGGDMCPAFRVSLDEARSPRGMANALRAALAPESGEPSLTAPGLVESLSHCVGCKACRVECPMGVDISRLKIEVDAARAAAGLGLREKAFAYLPRYAATARRWRWLLYARDIFPPIARGAERVFGFSADRASPRWEGRRFRPNGAYGDASAPEIALFADTFNLHFNPDNLRAAIDVLSAAGYRVHVLGPPAKERPLCCGRTFLSAGLVDEARLELQRLIAAATPYIAAGAPIVGLEPACLLTLRDEALSLGLGDEARRLAGAARLFEEFVADERDMGRFAPSLRPIESSALLHGHCHQKAFGAMDAARRALSIVPGLALEEAPSSCCGMAGGFGYRPENLETSLAMGELALFPAIRRTSRDTLVIADGFSCRQQIRDGAGRVAVHASVIFKLALNTK
ncbi:MAG: FAD-binding and (Fe-S)-binding domain-containing protein [Hyphomicrobiales bacterium]|nr:FAD-binding and (Fe-S)-binding domain-containing protein [Hyphomicrobiales bacterium]